MKRLTKCQPARLTAPSTPIQIAGSRVKTIKAYRTTNRILGTSSKWYGMPNVGTRGSCFKIDKRKEIVKITGLDCVRPVKLAKFEQNLTDSLFTFCHDEAPPSKPFQFFSLVS